MARKPKLNADYFPHYISKGAKISYMCKKHGNDGYAVWYKILEELTTADFHFINLKDNVNRMYLVSHCEVEEDKFKEILNDLSELGAIDKELLSIGVIFSQSLLESLEDVWKRRNVNFKTKEDLLNEFGSSPKLPTKTKERKTKQIKTEVHKFQDPSLQEYWEKWKEYKRQEKNFKFKNANSENLSIQKLKKLSKGDSEIAIKIIEQAMEFGYSGFFELKIRSVINNNKNNGSNRDQKLAGW